MPEKPKMFVDLGTWQLFETEMDALARRDPVSRTIGATNGGPKMRRILLLACFAILAIAVFAADTNPREVTCQPEINGVTPTATQPSPTQPPGPTPTPPPP